jgi:hypothetical protein
MCAAEASASSASRSGHRPHGDAHGRKRFFQWMKLGEQRRLDAFAVL